MGMSFDDDREITLSKSERKAFEEIGKEKLVGFYVQLPESLNEKLEDYMHKMRIKKKNKWLEEVIRNL